MLFQSAIMWKMKAPEKKPLVRRGDDDRQVRGRIRKSAQKKNIEPVKALSEFTELTPDSFC